MNPLTPLASSAHLHQRLRLHVRGMVQGVGFRPFVYGLALRYGLSGHVYNHPDGVTIEVEGTDDVLAAFQIALTAEMPPLAQIDAITTISIPSQMDSDFTILDSQTHDHPHTSAHIPPDVSVCDECLRELFDPANRRYRYPFINCMHCGPRFTIIQRLPYDRASTTMAGFAMCAACAAEYHDPHSRRFHAQPIACPQCGPKLWFQPYGGGSLIHGNDSALAATCEALRQGKIIAIKGLGGFHLVCDATNDDALQRLRERKGRVDKPFAVMVRDLEMARQYVEVDEVEAALLTSRQRPIVLLWKKQAPLMVAPFTSIPVDIERRTQRFALTDFQMNLDSAAETSADTSTSLSPQPSEKQVSPLSPLVAPHNPSLGIMLPYTPLHCLLLDKMRCPLVMTSGNLSGEPIAIDNAEALERLAPLVDGFLLHDRPIHTPCDDSVLRVYNGHELPIRRSRGYTPFPIKLPIEGVSVLATGGELKNTLCLAHQGYAFLSQHIGDMENLETLEAFEHAQAHLCTLYQAQPQAMICDLHPQYMTTTWAERYTTQTGLPLIRVQHHHAHIASVMVEHGLEDSQTVIGVCLDGTGYGTDGAIWGGEVLLADYRGFQRAAHLKYVPLPGGDTAVKRPYRMALAHLWAAGITWEDDLPAVAACPPAERNILQRQFETGFQTIPTSSIGRLFDAVAALIGVRQTVTYEAQAAMELEGIACSNTDMADMACHVPTGDTRQVRYLFDVTSDAHGTLIIDPKPLLIALIADYRAGVTVCVLSSRFHLAVAEMLVAVCERISEANGGKVVALSGGVFQNVRLLDLTVRRLRQHDFTVLSHRTVPSNDGGLALGQAIVGMVRVNSR